MTQKVYVGDDEVSFSKVITKDTEISGDLSWSSAKTKQELDNRSNSSAITALQARYQVVVNQTPSKASKASLGTQFTLTLTNVSGSTGDLYLNTI